MFAYRAGRAPRYSVICPVSSDRAASFALPLLRTETPSSIGWRTLPVWRRTSRSTFPPNQPLTWI